MQAPKDVVISKWTRKCSTSAFSYLLRSKKRDLVSRKSSFVTQRFSHEKYGCLSHRNHPPKPFRRKRHKITVVDDTPFGKVRGSVCSQSWQRNSVYISSKTKRLTVTAKVAQGLSSAVEIQHKTVNTLLDAKNAAKFWRQHKLPPFRPAQDRLDIKSKANKQQF